MYKKIIILFLSSQPHSVIGQKLNLTPSRDYRFSSDDHLNKIDKLIDSGELVLPQQNIDIQNLPDDPFGAYLGKLISESIQQVMNDYPLTTNSKDKVKQSEIGQIDLTDFESVGGSKDRALFDQMIQSFQKENQLRSSQYAKLHGPQVNDVSKISVVNYANSQLQGTITAGSNNQNLTVALDTGSQWLQLATEMWASNTGTKMFTNDSTTFKNLSSVQPIIPGYSTMGIQASDFIAIDANHRINFTFFAVNSYAGSYGNCAGILGLGRQLQYNGVGPLYVEGLKNASLITQEIFSVYISNTTNFVTFGPIDNTAIRAGSNIAWIPMSFQHYFWLNTCQGMRIGTSKRTKKGFTSSWFFDTKAGPQSYQNLVIWDTAISWIYVPEAQAVDLIYRLVKGKTYNKFANGMVSLSCADVNNYEDVFFLIGGYWLQMKPQDYIINLSGTCFLGFIPNPGNYFLIGLGLMGGYYTIHDNSNHANARIGFVPHSTSSKIEVAAGKNPSMPIQNLQWERTFMFDIYAYILTLFDAYWIFYVPAYVITSIIGPSTY